MQLPTFQTALIAALPFLDGVAAALNPACRPGGNFDLTKWDLETPINDGNGRPKVIKAAELNGNGDGCNKGWQDKGSDHQWFFTETTDGSLVMKAPGYSEDHPCIKWAESKHCRTEFRETKPASWSPTTATNRLHVKLVGIRGANVAIGQVFQVDNGANKPFAELYYRGSDGLLQVGVARCPGGSAANCNQDLQPIGKVPLGTAFSYDIRFERNVLLAGINVAADGTGLKPLTTYFNTTGASFKVGNYNQATDDASIHILELTTQH